MQLFKLVNHAVVYEPVVMEITAFKNLAKKNKDNDRLTIQEMAFIFFYCDPRSHFMSVLDDNKRFQRVKDETGMPEEWEATTELKEAIKYYGENSKTPSSALYEASIAAVKFIEGKLKNPEALLSELDSRGNPIYKLDNLTKMLKDVPDIMKKLGDAREQLIKELESNSGLKGGKTKAIFEDGI